MKDAYFKKLKHTAENYRVIATGQEITKGYKPDAVLQNGNSFIILECDTNTTRKGFVGGMIKAAKYLTGHKTGIVVFVLKERENTNVNQIHAHLTPYFEWVQPLTNLQGIYIIAIDKYCVVDIPLRLLDVDFIKHAKAILRT